MSVLYYWSRPLIPVHDVHLIYKVKMIGEIDWCKEW